MFSVVRELVPKQSQSRGHEVDLRLISEDHDRSDPVCWYSVRSEHLGES